jgi:glycosyltransferase involved in cell wall biosynthesis
MQSLHEPRAPRESLAMAESKARGRLLFEGWRFIPHSYALVAQSHCLSILKRGDVDLRFRDLPLYSEAWRRLPGVFESEQEKALAAIATPEPGFLPDATFSLRPEQPDFRPPQSGRKFVFGTAEHRRLATANLSGLKSAAEVSPAVSVVTPSRWAATAFERFGFSPERIHVIPHGVDPLVFRADEAARGKIRGALGAQNHFIFMSIGAMTWNKGLDILLAAFAHVLETERGVRLVLKGADALYPSQHLVREALASLPARARETVTSSLVYEGRTLSAQGIAHLIGAADCYVAPYRAEGFNMPVLEAMACGVPVICTAGGPTDEFSDPEFAARIRSRLVSLPLTGDEAGDALAPDADHLVELMRDAARHRDGAQAQGARAAAYVRDRFSWDAVTNLLLERVLPTSI